MKPKNKKAASSGNLKLEIRKFLDQKRSENSAMQKIIHGLRESRDDNNQ